MSTLVTLYYIYMLLIIASVTCQRNESNVYDEDFEKYKVKGS